MSDTLRLPPRPNLEQYRKLAKDFQAACKSADSLAIRRVASQWLQRLRRLRRDEITAQMRQEDERDARRVEQSWNAVRSRSERASRCTLADAQFFVARQHGFASWPRFARHLTDLQRADSKTYRFERAVEAIISGDVSSLRKILKADPGLIRARSNRDHRSTLLHYVSANGVEDFRQKTPGNIVEITRVLLDAGAEVDAESDAYGGGSTTLGLVATSVHPEEAGVQIPLLKELLGRGASKDLRSAGHGHLLITSCLANGQPKAAEFFAELGAPVDLEGAAGMGRLDLVKEFFEENREPRSTVTRKQMDSAFFYACWYGAKEVIEFLLERGVDPALRESDGKTGLHCVAFGAHTEAARLLIEHGTPIDVKEQSFNATALDVALWAWNRTPSEHRDRCYEMIALLAQAGLRLDPQHWTNPDGTSEMLDAIGKDARMLAALKA